MKNCFQHFIIHCHYHHYYTTTNPLTWCWLTSALLLHDNEHHFQESATMWQFHSEVTPMSKKISSVNSSQTGIYRHRYACVLHVEGVLTVALNIVGYPATQSSVWDKYEAHYAVDGDATTDFSADHCTATNHQPYPWWALDLKGTFALTEVTFVNRFYACTFCKTV